MTSMSGIYIPAQSAEDWRLFLADPEKQWRTGYSAKTLAYCWQEADGFPACVRKTFSNSDSATFRHIEPLLIIPEHKVNLPGGSAASQLQNLITEKYGKPIMSVKTNLFFESVYWKTSERNMIELKSGGASLAVIYKDFQYVRASNFERFKKESTEKETYTHRDGGKF